MRNAYYILRHGETLHQTEKKDEVYPWPEKKPVRLTKKGEKQAKKAAEKLNKKGIDLIYCSDATRTKQTAKIVARKIGTKIILDKRLRDVNLGIYNGGPKEKFYFHFPNNIKRFTRRPRGGESWNNVKKRMLGAVKDLEKRYKGKTILIVSHGDPLMVLQGILQGLSDKEILKQKINNNLIRTGEIRKIETKNGI